MALAGKMSSTVERVQLCNKGSDWIVRYYVSEDDPVALERIDDAMTDLDVSLGNALEYMTPGAIKRVREEVIIGQPARNELDEQCRLVYLKYEEDQP